MVEEAGESEHEANRDMDRFQVCVANNGIFEFAKDKCDAFTILIFANCITFFL